MWGKGAREPRPYAPTPLMTRQGLSRFDSPGSYAVCGVSDAAPDPSLVLQTPCLCVAYAFDTASAQVRRTAKAQGAMLRHRLRLRASLVMRPPVLAARVLASLRQPLCRGFLTYALHILRAVTLIVYTCQKKMSRLFSSETGNTLSFSMLSAAQFLDISQYGTLLCFLISCGIRVYMALPAWDLRLTFRARTAVKGSRRRSERVLGWG